MLTTTTDALPDAQAAPGPGQHQSLAWVGMEHIALPVDIAGRPVSARVNAGINLLADPQGGSGIHMSRLYLQLDELTQGELTPARLRTVLAGFLASHPGRCDRASLTLSGDVLLSRRALVSAHSGWKAYPIGVEATLEKTFSLTLDVAVPYSSTCPASAALSRHAAQSHFLQAFGDRRNGLTVAEIADWLAAAGMPATPHSQRSWAHIRLRLDPEARELPVAAAIACAEQALGTAVQTAVKRCDERAFALANGANLLFCEDAARRLERAFQAAAWCTAATIRVEHQESLHAHNAVAVTHWKGASDVT
ncbi:GTP cyclohydrolase FolE2 [Pantoea sp. 1.19]|uniref:GTP cyclohydrolase FolE2 n=1 Tax=Pantoea sp. 1.19 TaxID=1925589 RepID=UPI000948CCCE|nr:GTP cyclohydrolase FolE2 [Pantoea sp. 1.19]